MTLKISGPRAHDLVRVMADFSGLPLKLTGNEVGFAPNGIINPFESKTLQKLIGDTIGTKNVISITAFGGDRSHIVGGKKVNATWGDSFRASATYHLPARSVFVEDFREIGKHSPVAARILLGHVLKEYLGASRPAGMGAGKAIAHYHEPAIATEAEIAHDLTGRPIWSGSHRPWAQRVHSGSGSISVRSYGPSLKFQFHFDATHSLSSVKSPPGL